MLTIHIFEKPNQYHKEFNFYSQIFCYYKREFYEDNFFLSGRAWNLLDKKLYQ